MDRLVKSVRDFRISNRKCSILSATMARISRTCEITTQIVSDVARIW